MGAIPPDLLPTLFDPLTVGERRRDRTRGLGLGLFIAKEIIAAHGGQLSVRSNEADGTTFTISLPRSLAAADHAASEPALPTSPPEAAKRMPPPAKHPATATDEERFRLLVESVKDYAIFMLDPTGRVATWNVGAERIKGYTADEIIGQHFSRFYEQHEVDAGKCETRAGDRRRARAASRTRAGGCARTAPDSGPTSSSQRCATRRASWSASPR